MRKCQCEVKKEDQERFNNYYYPDHKNPDPRVLFIMKKANGDIIFPEVPYIDFELPTMIDPILKEDASWFEGKDPSDFIVLKNKGKLWEIVYAPDTDAMKDIEWNMYQDRVLCTIETDDYWNPLSIVRPRYEIQDFKGKVHKICGHFIGREPNTGQLICFFCDHNRPKGYQIILNTDDLEPYNPKRIPVKEK